MDDSQTERPSREATHPLEGPIGTAVPSGPTLSVCRGLIGAAIGAGLGTGVTIVLASLLVGAMLVASYSLPSFDDLVSMGGVLILIVLPTAAVVACAGFAARAPRGSYGFASTLACVAFGQLSALAVAGATGMLEKLSDYWTTFPRIVAIAFVLVSPSFLVALGLTVARVGLARRAERAARR